MKRRLLFAALATLACRAIAEGPWISVGGSGPVGPDSDGWSGNARSFAVEEGTAIVVRGDDGWVLRLDGALVPRGGESNRTCCIGFDGGPDGLPLDILLSGRSALSSGVEARNCSLLSIRGPGALSGTAAGPDAAAIATDGDLLLDGALVAAFADGGAALQAGGDVTVSNAAAVLLGARGIRAAGVSIAGSAVGICAAGEAVLADGPFVAEDAEGLLFSDADAVCAAGLDFRGSNVLSIVGNAAATGACAAVRQTSAEGGLVHAGGTTDLFAPGGTGIDAAGEVAVEGGTLSVADGPDGAEALSFFTAEGIAAAAGAVSGDGFPGDDALAALQEFFVGDGVAAFLADRPVPLSSDRPESGIRADGVRFDGGETDVSCRTGSAGIVAASSASVSGGIATVNGAAWVPPVRISFDANGGAVAPRFALVPAGAAIGTLPRPTRTGCVFLGWYTAATGGSAVSASTKFSKAATVYARWAKSTYKVAFAPNAGTGTMAAQTFSWGTAANLRKNAFVRSGHVFLGWSKTKNGALAYKDQASVKNLTAEGGTVVVHAVWAKTSYRVAFDPNGGRGSMKAQPMTYGTASALRKNAFTRKGWVFLGWARTKGGEVAFKNAQSVKNLTTNGGTVTLYAKWAKESYTVRFDVNGGKGSMSSVSARYGRDKSLPANRFYRDGRVFLGWALTRSDATAQKVALKDRQSIKTFVATGGTVTLYAVWRRYVPKTAGRIRFALCQTPCRSSSATAQIDATFAWARQSLKGDEDVIVFPELAFAPFTELKTAWKQGPTVWKKAAAFAKERKAYVLVNHPYRASSGSKMYNETRVYTPDGTVLAVYRKRVLARMDVNASFTAGPAASLARLPFAYLGLLICKDAFTPSKGSDRYTGADVLLVQFAHPGVNNRSAPEAKGFPTAAQSMTDLRNSRNGWRKLGKPYMAVNKSGPDGNYTLCGGTFAADKAGKIVNKADAPAKVVFVDYLLQSNGRIRPTPVLPPSK
jgi:uncharacterized repeat protein (TIGR02543 family)